MQDTNIKDTQAEALSAGFTPQTNSQLDALGVDAGRLKYLDTYLKEITAKVKNKFNAVYIMRRGEVILNGAYGVQTPDGPPLTWDAIYPLASITKPIIATLLAILQEDGHVDLWDKFNAYYPEFTGEKKDEVELWQVMAHCSGMSDLSINKHNSELREQLGAGQVNTWEEHTSYIKKLRELYGLPEAEPSDELVNETELLADLKAPLENDPGTAFSYCNNGYNLLGRLVEKVTGESIEEYASRRLFKPLGMEDTHFLLPEEKWDRVVKRDPSFHGAGWFNSESALSNTNGASGLKSTMRDLARFGQMYLQNGTLDGVRILSPATVRLLTTDHNSELPPSFWGSRKLACSWGLGWNVCYGKKDDLGLLRSYKAFDHAGAGGGRILIDPEKELVVAMYLVELSEMSYEYQSRVANIIYSALD